jgi:hypothetical protein
MRKIILIVVTACAILVPYLTEAEDTDQTLPPHKQAAQERALQCYQQEYRAGSDSIRVTSVEIQTDQPEPVAGWSGRYRTKGRAVLQISDYRGGTHYQTTARFEVITEQKPGEDVKTVSFIRK